MRNNKELIEPEHIGDGFYMIDTGYGVDVAINDHRQVVGSIDIDHIDNAITYLQRVKENLYRI